MRRAGLLLVWLASPALSVGLVALAILHPLAGLAIWYAGMGLGYALLGPGGWRSLVWPWALWTDGRQ